MILRTLSLCSLLCLSACGQLHPLADAWDDTAAGQSDTGLDSGLDSGFDTAANDTGSTQDTGLDTAGDTNPPGDTGADTGIQDAGSSPELLSFTVTDGGNGIADVAFEATDPDGDLDVLRLTVDGWDHDLQIPDDIDAWVPGGVSHVYWELPGTGSCGTSSSTFQGRVFDAMGRPSGGLSDSLTVTGTGAHAGHELEPNEWRSEATWIGALSKPATLTGSASDFGDDDYIAFTPCDTGSWQFTLDWTGGDDGSLSLYLYDDPSGLSVTDDFGFAQPKRVTWTLNAGQTYYLRVAAFDAISAWTITAQ